MVYLVERRDESPQRLVHVLAIAEERCAEYSFLPRAELFECRVAASVLHGYTRFNTMNTDDAEGEVE